MRQSSGPFTIAETLAGALALCVCLVLAGVQAVPSDAAPRRDRGSAQTIKPLPRAVAKPLPRAPQVRVAPKQRLSPNALDPYRRLQTNPSFTRPNVYGPNCRSSCGSRCQLVSCSGLDTSQCLSVRQRCRMGCSSRC